MKKTSLVPMAALMGWAAPMAAQAQQTNFDRCMSGAAAQEQIDRGSCTRTAPNLRGACLTRAGASAQRARDRCVTNEQDARQRQRAREQEAAERARLRSPR